MKSFRENPLKAHATDGNDVSDLRSGSGADKPDKYSLQAQIHRADTYSSFAVSFGLEFGFAANMLYAVEAKEGNGGGSSLLLASAIVMAFAISTSAYGMVVASMQYYHLKRLIGDGNQQQLISFMNTTSVRRARKGCKVMLPISLCSLIVALVLKFASSCSNMATVAAVSVILGATVLVVVLQESSNAYESLKFRSHSEGS